MRRRHNGYAELVDELDGCGCRGVREAESWWFRGVPEYGGCLEFRWHDAGMIGLCFVVALVFFSWSA